MHREIEKYHIYLRNLAPIRLQTSYILNTCQVLFHWACICIHQWIELNLQKHSQGDEHYLITWTVWFILLHYVLTRMIFVWIKSNVLLITISCSEKYSFPHFKEIFFKWWHYEQTVFMKTDVVIVLQVIASSAWMERPSLDVHMRKLCS